MLCLGGGGGGGGGGRKQWLVKLIIEGRLAGVPHQKR